MRDRRILALVGLAAVLAIAVVWLSVSLAGSREQTETAEIVAAERGTQLDELTGDLETAEADVAEAEEAVDAAEEEADEAAEDAARASVGSRETINELAECALGLLKAVDAVDGAVGTENWTQFYSQSERALPHCEAAVSLLESEGGIL